MLWYQNYYFLNHLKDIVVNKAMLEACTNCKTYMLCINESSSTMLPNFHSTLLDTWQCCIERWCKGFCINLKTEAMGTRSPRLNEICRFTIKDILEIHIFFSIHWLFHSNNLPYDCCFHSFTKPNGYYFYLWALSLHTQGSLLTI